MTDSPKMDPRCPLGLNDFPTAPCPLAVERLTWLRNNQGAVSHTAEQDRTGDCPYCVNDRASGYCFFAYMDRNGDQAHSAVQVAELCQLTQAAVAGAFERAKKTLQQGELRERIRG